MNEDQRVIVFMGCLFAFNFCLYLYFRRKPEFAYLKNNIPISILFIFIAGLFLQPYMKKINDDLEKELNNLRKHR